LNGDYVKHDVLFAMELLIAGLASNNENERLLMRAALNTLETLYRNVNKQVEQARDTGGDQVYLLLAEA